MNEPLEYATHQDSDRAVWESASLAIALAAPGMICTAIFTLGATFPYRIIATLDFLKTLFWLSLLIAIPCAIASIVIYMPRRGRQLRWHVILNLAVNVPGLLFAIFMFSMILRMVI